MALIFDLIIFFVIGLVAGAIASFYMGRQQELVLNLISASSAPLSAAYIAKLLGLTAYNVVGEIVVATIGAISALALAADQGDLSHSLPGREAPYITREVRELVAPVEASQLDSNAEVRMETEAHGLLSMPGVGFFGILIIGILAG